MLSAITSSCGWAYTDRSVPFGQVLAQQAVGVLAGAALPRAMGVAEVHTHPGGGGEFGVPGHLLVLAVGERLAHRRGDAAQLGRKARQQHQAAAALDEHSDGGAVGRAPDQIALPVPRHLALVHLGRAHVDADHLGDVAAPVRSSGTGHARAATLTQAGDELAAQLSPRVGVDRGVDRLVGHVALALFGDTRLSVAAIVSVPPTHLSRRR